MLLDVMGGGGLQHFSVSPSPLLVLVLVLVLFGTWSLTILVCLLIINGCRHFLLYPFHLTDTPSNCILPLIIIINKSMTKFLNQMLS